MTMRNSLLTIVLLHAIAASAQLTVTVAPPRATGQKVAVPISMKNGFAEKLESARAVAFLLDQEGKMVGQGTHWVIGGGKEKSGLAAGATNTFHFVATADKPITTTNLTAKVNFNRVVLEGGKVADVSKIVTTYLEAK